VTTPDPRPAGSPGDPLTAADPTVESTPASGAGPATPGPGPSGPATPGPATPGPATPGPAVPAPARGRRTGRTIGRTLAMALLVFVTVVLVLFVVFNTQTVDISLVFVDVEAPLVLALLIAAVLGGLVVALLQAVMSVRGRRKSR
jgi:uncharacterized integral membrane protein